MRIIYVSLYKGEKEDGSTTFLGTKFVSAGEAFETLEEAQKHQGNARANRSALGISAVLANDLKREY